MSDYDTLKKLACERDDMRRRLAIIRAEYERMKHNDAILSQPFAEDTMTMVAMDFWRVIKAAATSPAKETK